jgi:GntR family transcriptional regulator/MocR family aminotransferase
MRLPDSMDDKALALQLRQSGLVVRPLSGYCLAREDLKGLVIGYGYAPLAEIAQFGPLLAETVAAALKDFSPALN